MKMLITVQRKIGAKLYAKGNMLTEDADQADSIEAYALAPVLLRWRAVEPAAIVGAEVKPEVA